MLIDLKIKEEPDGNGGTIISFDKEALMNASIADIMRDISARNSRNLTPEELNTWNAVESIYRERLVAARQERNQLENLLRRTRARLILAVAVGVVLLTANVVSGILIIAMGN